MQNIQDDVPLSGVGIPGPGGLPLAAWRAGIPSSVLYAVALQKSGLRWQGRLGQINLGYQRHRYAAPCELPDPYRNLAVAADILKEHHRPAGENPPRATAVFSLAGQMERAAWSGSRS
jgi:soluble lytic murein transglycosylase-like protein